MQLSLTRFVFLIVAPSTAPFDRLRDHSGILSIVLRDPMRADLGFKFL